MSLEHSPARKDGALKLFMSSASDDPKLVLLNQNQLAKLLGCSARTLERQRLEGSGIPFCRVGRLVRYRLADVSDFLEAQRRRSTSDTGNETT